MHVCFDEIICSDGVSFFRLSAIAVSRLWKWWSFWSSTVHCDSIGNQLRSFTSCHVFSSSCSLYLLPVTGGPTMAGIDMAVIVKMPFIHILDSRFYQCTQSDGYCSFFAGVTLCAMPLTSWVSSQLFPRPSCCYPRLSLCLMREDPPFPLLVSYSILVDIHLSKIKYNYIIILEY